MQTSQNCPAELYGALESILKQTYFQTGAKTLRILSYSLIRHCHESWHESASEWDNVVGSSQKDIESSEPELQVAALKTLCIVPEMKMRGHLERERINLPLWLETSPHASVRRQCAQTMGVLLENKCRSQWMSSLLAVLWRDSDVSVATESARAIHRACLNSPLVCLSALRESAENSPENFMLVIARVKLLLLPPSSVCADWLRALALAASGHPRLAEYVAREVLTPRTHPPHPPRVQHAAQQALEMLNSKSDQNVSASHSHSLAWTRVSPDTGPCRVMVAHSLNRSLRRLTLFLRVVNVSTFSLSALRLILSRPSHLLPSRPGLLYHLIPALKPSQMHSFQVAFFLSPPLVDGALRFPMSLGPIQCRPYHASIVSAYEPVILTPAQWTEEWNSNSTQFEYSESLLFDMKDPVPASFHVSVRHGNRALLAARNLTDSLLLICIVGREIHYKSSDKDAIEEIVSNGGFGSQQP